MTAQIATRPVRLAVVGVNFGRHICAELAARSEGPVRLVGVCDLDIERAQAVAQTAGVPVVPDLDALLADPEVDAIGLYTGPNGRAALIRRILDAGKDVMTTKPFEIDAEAGLAVLQEARTRGRVVHMNSPNPRPYGEMTHIRAWIADGAIGRPTLAVANTWAYYGATPADGTWMDDPLCCPAAPIFRLGIYPLNELLLLFPPPVSVQVTHARVETRRPTPDNAAVSVLCADGSLITIAASFVVGGQDYYKNALTLCGTRGVIYHQVGPKPRIGEWTGNLQLSTEDGIETRTVTTHAGGYDWDFFAQRVRGEIAEDVTTPEQIVLPIRVMAAISRAELTGQTVAVQR